MRSRKKLAVALLALVAATALVACGGGGDGTIGEEIEVVSGEFVSLKGGPATDFQVFGEATLERADAGTTLSLNLSGLEPRTEYVAHLHTGSCDAADPGGPHFQFKKGGSEEPPNEIHLEFTSSAAGKATATATSNREVPVGEAGSVVVHTAEGDHEMAAYDPADAETVTALFVHEGGDHGSGKPEGEEQPQSEKIACAQLEGEPAGPTSVEEEAPGGSVPTIVVRNGEPVGGVQHLEFDAGEEIRFKVTSDAAEEIHVHGYDISKNVPAGGTVEFDFPAEIEGIFEAELEELGVQILELQVNP